MQREMTRMELKTARRMNHLKASEIREILKLAEKPEVISFAGGLNECIGECAHCTAPLGALLRNVLHMYFSFATTKRNESSN